ncbi:hypothetical protein SRABI106_02676 [Rahnella aquatilis]|nr:hypothetical protein SRABI106_02676 [Rahnella aquatilis]
MQHITGKMQILRHQRLIQPETNAHGIDRFLRRFRPGHQTRRIARQRADGHKNQHRHPDQDDREGDELFGKIGFHGYFPL